MKTLALLVTGFGLLGGVGCVHLQPVGPMAKTLGVPEPTARKSASGATVTAAKDAIGGPVLPTAPPPPAPAALVTPGEVTDANHDLARQRLLDEMEADRKAMDKMPRYSEISVIPGTR